MRRSFCSSRWPSAAAPGRTTRPQPHRPPRIPHTAPSRRTAAPAPVPCRRPGPAVHPGRHRRRHPRPPRGARHGTGRRAGGRRLRLPADAAGRRPVVRAADLALCHLEAPLGPLDGPFTGYPELQAPPQVATALKATGFDSCATASDHALDQGGEGVRRTLEALDTVGLRPPARPGTPPRPPARPCCAPPAAPWWHTSPTPTAPTTPGPAGRAVGGQPHRPGRILADARAARRAGADVVAVSLYWGTEYRTAPDARQRRLARVLTAARTAGRPDIDLIVGSHAHTPQPFERLHGTRGTRTPDDDRQTEADMHDSGTWVAYGLGDLLGGTHHDENGRMSAVARFTFTPPPAPGDRWKITKAEFLPLWWDAEAGRVINVNKAIRAGRPDLKPVRHSIRHTVLSRGARKAGLVMGR
ncbi:CapA family protein [Streptomyces noursei]|nr:CapA family protein [Streptomyces noursei]